MPLPPRKPGSKFDSKSDRTKAQSRIEAESRSTVVLLGEEETPQKRKPGRPKGSTGPRRPIDVDPAQLGPPIPKPPRKGTIIHSVYDLGPDTKPKKGWPELIDPRKVRIQEAGSMNPLIWDISDEHALDRKCMFSPDRAFHIRDIVHTYFKLWEGEYAGKPARLEDDWQWPCLARIFGWVINSKKWQRWLRRFRDADIWIPKKSKKSPTAAFVGIYLWAFDGEPGQQVHSVAKDGKQAMRVHNHALNMVLASRMMGDVKHNKSTHLLLHKPSMSVYAPLSGDNISSQEGLNGSMVMDESHVIPQRLADVLRGMGASRSEPLNFRVSTAGADPESYGRRRYELGKLVASGKTKTTRTFFKAYEAPQDISDEELEDPKWWKLANPCWGTTIDPVEFEAEFRECRPNIIEWTNFKQRRLNIWQQSDNPWVVKSDWDACYTPDFPLEKLKEIPCSVGGDFSKTRDLTSIALVWELPGTSDIHPPSLTPMISDMRGEGTEYMKRQKNQPLMAPGEIDPATQARLRYQSSSLVYVWEHFWIPEAKVHQYRDQIPFRDWAKEGHITITRGRVLDETRIKNDIGDIFREFKVGVYGYDPLFATNIATKLQADGHLGFEYIEFKQSLFHFTKPTIRVDKLIEERRFRHNGNPCLTWQFLHARLYRRDDYIKPVKPESPNMFRSVDGVQSAIMGVSGLDKLPFWQDPKKVRPILLTTSGVSYY